MKRIILRGNFLLGILLLLFSLFLGCSNSDNQSNVEGNLIENPKEGTIYATWVNVWVSDLESWWTPASYNGITVNTGEESWKAINWRNEKYRKLVYDDLVDAGINLIITDNTNGKFDNTKLIANDLKNGEWDLKYCVALKASHMKDATFMKELSAFVEDNPYYYRLNGKPIIIAYVVYRDFLVLQDVSSDEVKAFPSYEYFKQFDVKWASGEVTKPNKWGWQLEPQDGYAAGSEADFVTPSVKHTAVAFDVDSRYASWSRSMAFLDYSFALARIYKPDHIIVGSYDDTTERNGWMPMNTTNALYSGCKMYSPWTGDTSDSYVFRKRVEDWIKGNELEVHPGGNLPDGIYRIKNQEADKYMRANSDVAQLEMGLGMMGISTHDKFVLYHISDKEYRIVNVYTGMPLMIEDNVLMTDVWTKEDYGLFSMEETENSGADVWTFEPITLFTEVASSANYKIRVKSSRELLMQYKSSIYAVEEK